MIEKGINKLILSKEASNGGFTDVTFSPPQWKYSAYLLVRDTHFLLITYDILFSFCY